MQMAVLSKEYKRVPKSTFKEFRCGDFDMSAFCDMGRKAWAFAEQRIVELLHGASLTVPEFRAIGRSPASVVPEGVWSEERKRVSDLFPQSSYKRYDDAGYKMPDTWEQVEEWAEELTKPVAKLMVSRTQSRPKHILWQIMKRDILNAEISEIVMMAAAEHWPRTRTCCVLSYACMASAFGLNELMHCLRRGGAAMGDKEWVAAFKEHHRFVKVRKRCLSAEGLMEHEDVIWCIYFSNLVGRDLFMDEEGACKEAEERIEVPPDYVSVSKGDEGDASALRKRALERLVADLIGTGHHVTVDKWNDFGRTLYRKLAGGSSAMPGKLNLDDIGSVMGVSYTEKVKDAAGNETGEERKMKIRLRGSKRLVAEIYGFDHFSKYGKWKAIAFLKYEPGKNRWLYPASAEYALLGLYLMDPISKAFMMIPGVDYGHDLQGSVATKLDVWARVKADDVGLNVDGTNFNGKHSYEDMKCTYDSCKIYAETADDKEALEEYLQAVDKYTDSLRGREFVLSKMPDGEAAKEGVVDHTLFSGETPTMFTNTGQLKKLGDESAYTMIDRKCAKVIRLFYKGDDLNGFLGNWLVAALLVWTVEQTGMELNRDKDHIEFSHSEHERCLVTKAGYAGAPARRCGSMVVREPQGSAVLTMPQMVAGLNTLRGSLMARTGNEKGVEAVIRSVVATHMDSHEKVDDVMYMAALPSSAGGFGAWRGDHDCRKLAKKYEPIEVKIVIHEDGLMGPVGSCKMTDPVIADVKERFPGHNVAGMKRARDKMASACLESAIGVARYGSRVRKEKDDLEQVAKRTKRSVRRNSKVRLSEASEAMAGSWSDEFAKLLNSPAALRVEYMESASSLILLGIARMGLYNEELAMAANNLKTQRELHLLVLSKVGEEREAVVAKGALSKISKEVQSVLFRGELHAVFWKFGDKISPDLAALVRKFVTHRMTVMDGIPSVTGKRTLEPVIQMELAATMICSVIYERNREVLDALSY